MDPLLEKVLNSFAPKHILLYVFETIVTSSLQLKVLTLTIDEFDCISETLLSQIQIILGKVIPTETLILKTTSEKLDASAIWETLGHLRIHSL